MDGKGGNSIASLRLLIREIFLTSFEKYGNSTNKWIRIGTWNKMLEDRILNR